MPRVGSLNTWGGDAKAKTQPRQDALDGEGVDHQKKATQTVLHFELVPASLILVTSTGGCGGFFASVRDIGVTGQQQHAKTVSADEATRGGAGGFLSSRGGGTKPGSPVPSPARRVPVQKVAARAERSNCFTEAFFIFITFCM